MLHGDGDELTNIKGHLNKFKRFLEIFKIVLYTPEKLRSFILGTKGRYYRKLFLFVCIVFFF